MPTLPLLRDLLRMTDEGLTRITADLLDKPLLRPTARGGNHPHWIVGHIAFVEGAIRAMITGEPNPLAGWEGRFGMGSTPAEGAEGEPSIQDLLAKAHALRAENMALLERIGEEGLGRVPASIPPGFEREMRTVGHAFSILCIHQMVHYGQLTVVRRAAGLAPLI